MVSIVIESLASATEIGTGDDLIIAFATSDAGNALRFRDGVERDEPLAGVENSLSNVLIIVHVVMKANSHPYTLSNAA